jgi:hypothetical protein
VCEREHEREGVARERERAERESEREREGVAREKESKRVRE